MEHTATAADPTTVPVGEGEKEVDTPDEAMLREKFHNCVTWLLGGCEERRDDGLDKVDFGPAATKYIADGPEWLKTMGIPALLEHLLGMGMALRQIPRPESMEITMYSNAFRYFMDAMLHTMATHPSLNGDPEKLAVIAGFVAALPTLTPTMVIKLARYAFLFWDLAVMIEQKKTDVAVNAVFNAQ